MPDVRPVDYQEAVVALFADMHLNRCILAVVLLLIQLQLAADSLRVYVSLHADIALAEHQQYGLVDVVIYQQQGYPCRAYQVRGELVGVEDLAVVEDAFHGRQ